MAATKATHSKECIMALMPIIQATKESDVKHNIDHISPTPVFYRRELIIARPE